jgi:hypothetical protein
MRSPFPGMNPYLEQPAFWSSFHTRLMVAIADTVAPPRLLEADQQWVDELLASLRGA